MTPLSLTGKLIETEKQIYSDGRPVTQISKNRIFNPFHTITSKISNETQVFETLEDTGYDSSEELGVKHEIVTKSKSKSKIVKSLLEPSLFEKLTLGVETILHRVLVLFNILRSFSSIPDNAKLMTSDLSLMHVYACLFKVSRKFKNKKVQTINDFNVRLRDSLPDIERLTLKETHSKKPDKDKPDMHVEVKEEENSNDSGLDDFNERLETALDSIYRRNGFQYQKFTCSQTLMAVMTEIEVDAMVTISNLAFEIDFIGWPEKTVYEVINTILTSITQTEDCEFWDGIDAQTPSKHNLAIETLIKLSTKLSNMDMIWMTPELGIMERMITIFVTGVNCRDNQIYRELCLSALSCVLPSHNSIAQDVENFTFDNQDEVSTNTFMNIMKTHKSKPVNILLNFLEDSVGISPTTDVIQKRLSSQDPQTGKHIESQPMLRCKYFHSPTSDYMMLQAARLLTKILTKEPRLLKQSNTKHRLIQLCTQVRNMPRIVLQCLSIIK